MADSLELQAEQDYFDKALETLGASLATLKDSGTAAADNKTRNELLKRAAQAEIDARSAYEEGVAFGRFEFDDEHRSEGDENGRVYLGKVAVFSDADFPLVVNWQRPVAARYYEASHEDPQGVVATRAHSCERNKVIDFEEVLLGELSRDVAKLLEPDVDDTLLAELGRSRTGELRDIVRTIRAAQHRIIRSDIDQLLVVQGGPGTGKSVLALHRVSWLLWNHQQSLSPEQVLVIGPNPTFIRYIRDLLPALGDRAVRHEALNRLGPGNVAVGRDEPADVARLKGDLRMRRLLERGIADRITVPDEDDDSGSQRGRSLPRLPLDEVRATVGRLRAQPYSAGRNALREYLRGVLRDGPGSSGSATAADPWLDRIWPQLTPGSFLQELLGSEARLLRAAGDDFTAGEVRALHRRAAERLTDEEWSEADIALLDYAERLISGPGEQFGHIVVDEAQDLSPMQLESVARRSRGGSMTVLGDIAQSTGVWARDSWDEVVSILEGAAPSKVVELEVGYRVPAEAFRLAAALLPVIAPGVMAPRVVRSGSNPEFLAAENEGKRSELVVDQASSYAARGQMVGIICPEDARDRVATTLKARDVKWRDASAGELGAGINLVDPRGAKGLEFDAVIVVEPELIVASDERGGRLLYVALTRTTQHLAIVHIGDPLPLGSGQASEDAASTKPPADRGDRPDNPASTDDETSAIERPEPVELPRAVRLIAAAMAAEIRETLREDQIPLVLRALIDELGEGGAEDPP